MWPRRCSQPPQHTTMGILCFSVTAGLGWICFFAAASHGDQRLSSICARLCVCVCVRMVALSSRQVGRWSSWTILRKKIKRQVLAGLLEEGECGRIISTPNTYHSPDLAASPSPSPALSVFFNQYRVQYKTSGPQYCGVPAIPRLGREETKPKILVCIVAHQLSLDSDCLILAAAAASELRVSLCVSLSL
ncbi:hypothetical protein BD289DRAFT_199690 [Coniella lustricola]|uniref:Uncharacterized protein n=1 Tax=Coniella lustricola TaxID=2025994 RepID=A0A2T3ACP6_9PEZI|nr:hypothetical protein BD289DRAFT_199690 [Coniella lustricola]